MVFHGSLSDCKSYHAYRTLLSILADLNNAAVWIVSASLQFPTLPGPAEKISGPFQARKLQMVAPSASSSIVFFSYLVKSK